MHSRLALANSCRQRALSGARTCLLLGPLVGPGFAQRGVPKGFGAKQRGSHAATKLGVNMQKIQIQLSMELLRVVEQAAIASARTMGTGDRHKAAQAATETMRHAVDHVPRDGRVVGGEGEREEAPVLFRGKKGGPAAHNENHNYPAVDIAVDPLEGTNLCATGAPNAITVLAASEKGGLLHAPDLYMEKIVGGPSCKGAVDLDAPVADNIRAIARRLNRDKEEPVVIVLDRPRHEKLIEDIRATGARIRLISDGDLSAGISAAVVGAGGHALMSTGGAPEGVLTPS